MNTTTQTLESGMRIGELMLLSKALSDDNRRAQWLCVCTCLKQVTVRADNLRSGRTKSCGCQQHKTTGRRNQMSPYRLPQDQARFTIQAYITNKQNIGHGKEHTAGFAIMTNLAFPPHAYQLTRCTNRPVTGGYIQPIMMNALSYMARGGWIGPRNGLSVSDWAKREGVEFVAKEGIGLKEVYAMHADLVAKAQPFNHNPLAFLPK